MVFSCFLTSADHRQNIGSVSHRVIFLRTNQVSAIVL